jgi:hypothetical protein
MDKPVSLSVKDYLIRMLAIKSLTSEATIEAVVTHQFQSANEAMDTNDSIEISGFGKFYFNKKKAINKLKQLEILVKEQEGKDIIETTKHNIALLKRRLNEA